QYEPWKILPTERKEELMSRQGGFARSVTISHYTSISITNHYGIAYTDEENEVLKRFGKVFEQSYVRFLDLQKAEAQAREAQIEAALEKVRSRSMAMHKSDEFPEVIQLVFEQFRQLNFTIDSAQFDVSFRDTDDLNLWTAIPTLPYPERLHIPYMNNAVFNSIKNAKKAGLDCISNQFTREEKVEFFKYFFEHCPNIPEERKQLIFSSPGFFRSAVLLKNVSLGIQNYAGIPYTDPEIGILRRFAKAFEQAYARFLDLQKAEAQAREAEIQLGLERVRARTMAMQNQNDLLGILNLLFEQLIKLGVELDVANFSDGHPQGDLNLWITGITTEGTIYTDYVHFRRIDHPYFQCIDKALEIYNTSGTDLNKEVFTKKEKDTFQDYIFSQTIYKDVVPDEGKKYIYNKQGYSWSSIILKEAWVSIARYNTTPFTDEEDALLRRFANAFDLAYTRFLDLQKAENQAREAQIEAALEKVRSRSLAMQNPEELTEVAQLLREEMGNLGVEALETSSIYIHDENTGLTQCWFTIKNSGDSPKAVTDQMTLDLQDTWVGRQMLDFYRSPENQTSILMQGENRKAWIRYCEEKSELFGTSNFYGEIIPERTYHLYKFSNGFIGAAAPGDISGESWDLLKRATAVFSFAYTRFQDLQKAEASAIAALRQASLDRIRADISSMRHADDLDRITPLIFNELTVLGVPFIRCGVFIIQEKQKIVEAYLSSPEGNSLGVLRLPFEASEHTYETVKAFLLHKECSTLVLRNPSPGMQLT
nr:hypothetical protein [Chitinophagaceae bacterium]